jgi:hypothetical protein
MSHSMQAALWTVFYTAPRLQTSGGEIGLGEAFGIIAAWGVIVAAVLFFVLRER